MVLEVKIEKKYVFIFLGLVLLIGGIFIATAYGTNNPPSFGHTPGELSAGTFGGTASDAWRFPGAVHFGGASDPLRGFYVTSAESGPRALYLANGTWPQGSVDAALFPEDKRIGIWTQNPRAETHIRQETWNALRLSSGTAFNSALQLYNNDASGGYWGWTILKLGSTGSGDFQINYDRGENGADSVPMMILKRNGDVLFPTLNGAGNAHLCIDSTGKMYRGTASSC
jgi:hypothetical protein